MASVNKVIIIGRLGQDPEIRQFNNGDKIANLSVATSNKWTDKATGEAKEQTEWHRVVLLGNVANVAEQYLRKGSQIYVEGSLHTRKWQDNNGIDRYSTEIKCYTMQMLGGGQQQQNGGGYPSQQGYPQPQGGYQNQPQTQGYQPMGQPQGYPQQPSPQGYPQPPMQGVGSSSYQPMTSHAPVPPHTPTATDDDMPF